MIMLAALSATMMASVPSIASSLMGGGSGAGFGGFSHLTRSRATQGITGGMSVKGSPGGGAGKGPPSGNAFSGMTNMMPNVAKPFTAAAGAGMSKLGGYAAAGSAMTAAKKNESFGISRDMSKMSAATAKSYISRLEKVNANHSDLKFGPPAPAYTVSKPVSSTTPQKG